MFISRIVESSIGLFYLSVGLNLVSVVQSIQANDVHQLIRPSTPSNQQHLHHHHLDRKSSNVSFGHDNLDNYLKAAHNQAKTRVTSISAKTRLRRQANEAKISDSSRSSGVYSSDADHHHLESDQADSSAHDSRPAVISNKYQQQTIPAANPNFEAAFQGECSRNNTVTTNPCDHICLDLHDGTYECSCFYGFALAVDGYSCTQLTNLAAETAAKSGQVAAQPTPADNRQLAVSGRTTATLGNNGLDSRSSSREQELAANSTVAADVAAALGTPKTTADGVANEAPEATVELMHGGAVGPVWPVDGHNDVSPSVSSSTLRPQRRPQHSGPEPQAQPLAGPRHGQAVSVASTERVSDRKLDKAELWARRFNLQRGLTSGTGADSGATTESHTDEDNGDVEDDDDDIDETEDANESASSLPSAGQRFYRRRQDLANREGNGHYHSKLKLDQDGNFEFKPKRHDENALAPILGAEQHDDRKRKRNNELDDGESLRDSTAETKFSLASKVVAPPRHRYANMRARRNRLNTGQRSDVGAIENGLATDSLGRRTLNENGSKHYDQQQEEDQNDDDDDDDNNNDAADETDCNRIDPEHWISKSNEQLEEADDAGDAAKFERETPLEGSDKLMMARARTGGDQWAQLATANDGRPQDVGSLQAGPAIVSDKDHDELNGGVNPRGWRKNGSINRLADAVEWSQQDRLLGVPTTSSADEQSATVSAKQNQQQHKQQPRRAGNQNEIIGLDGPSYGADGGGGGDDDDDDVRAETLEDFDGQIGRRSWQTAAASSARRRRLDYDLGLLESLVGKTMGDFYQQLAAGETPSDRNDDDGPPPRSVGVRS